MLSIDIIGMIRIMKSRMKWEGHAARKGEKRIAYK
jgi:hypothetical protein